MKILPIALLFLAGTTVCAAAQDYPALVQGHHLQEADQLLSGVFPHDASGQACARLVTLHAYRDVETGSDESAQMEADLNVLRAHPAQTLHSLASGLPLLPDRYADARHFLVQFAARLDADREKRIRMLSNELARPWQASADPHDRQAFFDGAIALDSLLEITRDPKVIHAALNHAFAMNASESWRGLVLSRYEAADADGARAFRVAEGV